MHDYIPLSVPNLKGRELEYVKEAVSTEWVSSSGPYIAKFEEAFAEYIGIEDAVAVQSGTAGLQLAYMEAGVTKDDMVIVPVLTFIGTLNPVGYINAEPVFMDCDDYLGMDTQKLRAFCEKECELRSEGLFHKQKNKRVKAIVPVHVFGNLCDMEEIMDIAEEFHLKVIEDASESLGSFFTSGRYCGLHAGTIGDIAVVSFNGNKIITTGGGGMIIAKDKAQLEHMRYLSRQSKDDELRFIHNEIGYNYRMTNLQAALGLAQLEQLDSFLKIKKRNYEIYKEEGLNLLNFKNNISANYWFYSLITNGKKEYLIEQLQKNNIGARPIWELMHRLKPFRSYISYEIEKAVYYHSEVVNIPCSTNLDEDTTRHVARVIKGLLS